MQIVTGKPFAHTKITTTVDLIERVSYRSLHKRFVPSPSDDLESRTFLELRDRSGSGYRSPPPTRHVYPRLTPSNARRRQAGLSSAAMQPRKIAFVPPTVVGDQLLRRRRRRHHRPD